MCGHQQQTLTAQMKDVLTERPAKLPSAADMEKHWVCMTASSSDANGHTMGRTIEEGYGGLCMTLAGTLSHTCAPLTSHRIMMWVCMSPHHDTIALKSEKKSLMLKVTSTVS
jgi:hypothetical protein